MLPTSNAVPSPPTDLAKLDELEALTKEYSLYSRSAFGLGHLPGLALLILGLALNMGGIRPWGIVIAAAAPWVWLATREPIRRRLYQREGRVTERATATAFLLVLRLVQALIVVLLANQTRTAYHDLLWRPVALPIAASAISILAFAVVGLFRLRSLRDAGVWYWFGFCVAAVPTWAQEPQLGLLLYSVINALLFGANEHFKYRRLERRLASLRTSL